MQAKTPAIARPPGKCPTQAMEKRMMRRATPPVDMKDEARMKNGIANKREVPLEGRKQRLGDRGER